MKEKNFKIEKKGHDGYESYNFELISKMIKWKYSFDGYPWLCYGYYNDEPFGIARVDSHRNPFYLAEGALKLIKNHHNESIVEEIEKLLNKEDVGCFIMDTHWEKNMSCWIVKFDDYAVTNIV